jgi:hypothetical protein
VIVMSASAIDLTGLYVSEQGRLQRFINRLVGNRAFALLSHPDREKSCHRSSAPRKDAAQYKGALGPPDGQACSRPQPDAIVQGRQELAVLRRVIGQLPVKCRTVFLLSREHGLTCGGLLRLSQ